jgi:hypothetical protein
VRWIPGLLSVVLLVCQVVAMAAITITALMYDEDWWDDFRDQNRAIALGILASVASVAVGAWLGTT